MIDKTTAIISLENLEHNIKVAKSKINPETKMLCVVKADAYGHGAVEISKKLYSLGIRNFGVATIDEALEIRKALADSEILIFGFTNPDNAKILSDNNITQAIYSKEFSEKLSESSEKNGCSVKVHIAFDTGMNRIGFKNVAQAVACAKLKGVEVCGAFTHFACADGVSERETEFTKEQYRKFLSCIKDVKAAGISLKTCHCANSAAIFNYPELQLDMVRLGISMYGLSSDSKKSTVYKDIKPVMQLKSPVSNIKTLEKGESIGYGATYTADRQIRVATISCGYADGYRRSFSKGYVLICGKRAKILGRICMDQFMVDVTDIKDAQLMSEATLLGTDGREQIFAEDLAALDSTIDHEIVCGISKRVKRIYK